MTQLLSDYITLYISSIPYAVFFLFFNDRKKELKKTLLFFLPYNLLFLVVYRASLLIPNELAGMLVKTIASRILIVVYFQRVLKISVLRTLLQSYLASAIIMFSELFLSAFLDVSGFTHYLTQEQNIGYELFVSVIHCIVESVAAALAVLFIKRKSCGIQIPTRYLLIAIFSLLLVTVEGALLYYLNNSSAELPVPVMILIVSAAMIAAVLPLLILSDQERVKRVLAKLPVFSASRKHLNDQIRYLQQQMEELKSAEQSLAEYKAKGDFSASVNDVFASREDFNAQLYTDNPVINTLLLSYADRFEQDGTKYQFEIQCSTYTELSDYFLIYVFSGMLDSAKQYVNLAFRKNVNI